MIYPLQYRVQWLSSHCNIKNIKALKGQTCASAPSSNIFKTLFISTIHLLIPLPNIEEDSTHHATEDEDYCVTICIGFCVFIMAWMVRLKLLFRSNVSEKIHQDKPYKNFMYLTKLSKPQTTFPWHKLITTHQVSFLRGCRVTKREDELQSFLKRVIVLYLQPPLC